MARRQASTPRPGRSLIDGVLGRTGLGREARDYRALYAWHRLAGPRLARHTAGERVLGTTLIVRVATAPWANELSYLRAQLLARLQADAAASWITELRFSIGPLAGLPDWSQADRELAPPHSTATPPVIEPGPVVEALLGVKDPELRAALGELFAHALAPTAPVAAAAAGAVIAVTAGLAPAPPPPSRAPGPAAKE